MSARKTLLALMAVLLVGVLALSGCTTKIVTTSASGAANTVTASGSGTSSATPDEATMSFGVTSQAKDAKAALNAASKTADKIAKALRGAGVDNKDIQTQNVNVYPTYGNDGNKITGYQANLSVTAKVRELDSLGDVIAAATNARSRGSRTS